jgi:RNA recognition motif-containing protein
MDQFSSNEIHNNLNINGNRSDSKVSRNKLFVENLEYTVHEKMLKKFFSKFGEVKKCKIIHDSNTGYSKGFGFVEFFNENDAANVFNASRNDLVLNDREIKIDYFREKKTKKKKNYFNRNPNNFISSPASSSPSHVNNTTITITNANEINESHSNEDDNKFNFQEMPYNVLSLIFSKLAMRDLCMVERGIHLLIISLI